ncbi:hypothetical protein [Nonomuraea basaltis]|uniref:hypothetical protein n=1 Tax=Nonomuraea basaltis TaxID=2495887 RepID=UPI00110C4315|nr:hypothetical protein [Nonomuraea basaltis]TMR88149.1 hypothetical protein EJK15_67815 [Nonomuraea basaltis]
MLVFRDIRVFTGEDVIRSAEVTVAAGVIVSVADIARGRTPAPGDEVIEGRGRTLLPGLIDAHAHVFPGDLEQAALFGVTTVLDMMSDPAQAKALRETGGADLRTAGTAATVPGGYVCM